MDNNQKANIYNNLMYEYDILENKINVIRSKTFELSPVEENEIKKLKFEQGKIMQQVDRLLML
jgi:hypothetical protein